MDLSNFENFRSPSVNLEPNELEFTAQKIGEKLTKTVTVINQSPETVLEGKWSVSPHRSDPPHTPDVHSWIQIKPQQFSGNQVQCQVTVDTNKLRANKDYEREIILSSNTEQENYYLKVKVRTATPVAKKPPYLCLAVFSLIGGAIVILITTANGFILVGATVDNMLMASMTGGVIGGAIGGAIGGDTDRAIAPAFFAGAIAGAMFACATTAAILGTMGYAVTNYAGVQIIAIAVAMVYFAIIGGVFGAIHGITMGLALGSIIRANVDAIFNNFKKRGFNKYITWLYILLSGGLGISIGIAKIIGLSPYIILALAATGLPLAGMLIYHHLKQRILTAQYYRHEAQNLIEP